MGGSSLVPLTSQAGRAHTPTAAPAHAHAHAHKRAMVAVQRPLEDPDLVRRCTGLIVGDLAGLYRAGSIDLRQAAQFKR
jgi:hypothetical protein